MKRYLVLCFILVGIALFAAPKFFYKNDGKSISNGKPENGSLQNAYLLPRKGPNFAYGSWFSYYILGHGYVNSKVYQTISDTYSELQTIYPNKKFFILECSRKNGGKMFPHRTHQNGLSVDFFTPLIKNGNSKYYRSFGIFRYALNFISNGTSRLNSKVKIDFNTMTRHILVLEKNARKNGLRIKKVIFNTALRDSLFSTENGKILKKKNIYFARNLSPQLNRLHDDHYHIDFEPIR